jgi:hypothetical protein
LPELPKSIDRVLELLLLKMPAVRTLLDSTNVPAVSVKVLVVPIVRLPASVNVPPAPLSVNPQLSVTEFVVIVTDPVDVKVTVPVLLQTVPDFMLNAVPATVSVGAVPCANVTVPCETVRFAHDKAPVRVTV